jgi:hypothetical protein
MLIFDTASAQIHTTHAGTSCDIGEYIIPGTECDGTHSNQQVSCNTCRTDHDTCASNYFREQCSGEESTDANCVPCTPAIITVSRQHVECRGGTTGAIDLSVSGGVEPYTYQWFDGVTFAATTQDISDLAAGTYTVTITDDNGCETTKSVVVNEPAALTAVASPNPVPLLCYGDTDTVSISAAVNTGTPPYTGAGIFYLAGGEATLPGSSAIMMYVTLLTLNHVSKHRPFESSRAVQPHFACFFLCVYVAQHQICACFLLND